MRTLVWSNTFIRAFKKTTGRRPGFRKDIEAALRHLMEDPFNPLLETHKLKGRLSGAWACSAGYDLRIVFEFVKAGKGKNDDIFLLEIGTHDEVY
ncbi:MAG: type II toxin-antitoxin system YafQ family toxin [Deltaproteobacteria bacterium]|nr:type II toxin-antitoxin system YafQ family toxin [Deltaproteobacteria bacterium]